MTDSTSNWVDDHMIFIGGSDEDNEKLKQAVVARLHKEFAKRPNTKQKADGDD